MQPVKRGYRSATRRAKVAETRRRILDAAQELFLASGYGATSIEAIAEAAGVSVPTVYVRFETKPLLLKALVDRTIAGDDEPVPMLERPWMRQALSATTAPELLRRVVVEARPILERTVPLVMVVRAAAGTDADVAELWETLQEQRHTVAEAIVQALKTRGPRPRGLTRSQIADFIYAQLSPDMYQILVVERGWTPAAWERWITAVLIHQVTSPRQAQSPRSDGTPSGDGQEA
jgi:AcrR family transcriptional regulator